MSILERSVISLLTGKLMIFLMEDEMISGGKITYGIIQG